MDRREFLASTTAAASAGVSLASTASAAPAASAASSPLVQNGRFLRLALPRSIETLDTGTAAHRLAHRLAIALGGARIDILTVETSGADAVRSGAADFYYGFEGDHAHLHPAFAAVGGMPLGEHMAAMHHYAWLVAGDGGDAWDDLSAAYGLKAFAAGHTGPSQGLYSEHMLDGTDDLRGLRVACHGLALDVVAALGAKPVAIDRLPPDGGSIAALGIDALETFGEPAAAIAHWRHLSGLMPEGLTYALGMRRDLWAAMTGAEQLAVEAIAGDEFVRSLANASIRSAALARVGQLRRWPVATAMSRDIAAAIEAASAATLDRLAAVDPLSARLIASYRAFRSNVTAGAPERPDPIIA